MYKLVIEDDEGHTTIVALVKDEITIGRKEGNTIRLTERNVSRHHARLVKSDGSVFIEDLDSYNGVKVNGDRISARTTVREGDLVEIGDYHLALQWVADGQAEQRPPPLGEGPPPLVLAQARAPGDEATAIVRLPVEERRALEPGRVRSIPEAVAGRLVVFSTDLAGSEFLLTKTEMRIGRTPENDIVLPHRSVSSNHAKIVYDGGIYRIIDLDSANGILVNGEEYSRVDIRQGDLIELGHVRILYIAPGEEGRRVEDGLVAKEEPKPVIAEAVEARAGRAFAFKQIGLIAGGVALLLLVIFGMYQLFRTDQTQEDAATQPDQLSQPEATPPVSEDPAAAFFKEGMDKYKAEDFDGAVAAFNTALEKNPDYPGAENMRGKAEKQKEYGALLQKAKAALAEKDFDAAWELIDQIPPESVFGKQVEDIKPGVKKQYIAFHLNQAKTFSKAGVMDKAIKHIDSVLFVDEENPEAANLKKTIQQIQKTETTKEPLSRLTPAPATKKKKEAAKRKSKEVGELLAKGTNLAGKKLYTDSIEIFKKVLQAEPKNCVALKSIGVVYAYMGEREKAAQFYQKFLSACPKHMQAPQVRTILKNFYEFKKQNR